MTLTREQRQTVEAFIFEAMDFTGYFDDEHMPDTELEKATSLYNIFMVEKGQWEMSRGTNRQNALIDWLQGLPSSLHIPFNYVDIIAKAKELKTIPQDASEKKLDAVCEKWFPWLSMRILGLWSRYKVI